MISVQNIKKEYGHQLVFDDVSFSIADRERIGLVGRNGHGKTTLFRLLTGVEPCDEGQIIIPKDYRIGYLKQDFRFTCATVFPTPARCARCKCRSPFFRVPTT